MTLSTNASARPSGEKATSTVCVSGALAGSAAIVLRTLSNRPTVKLLSPAREARANRAAQTIDRRIATPAYQRTRCCHVLSMNTSMARGFCAGCQTTLSNTSTVSLLS